MTSDPNPLLDFQQPWADVRRHIEGAYFEGLLVRYSGNVAACARHARIDAANIRRIFARHGLRPDAFRPVPVKPLTETAEQKSTGLVEKSCNST